MDDVFDFKSVDGNSISEKFQIGTCGTAYHCPSNHNSYIFFINVMLFFGDEFYRTILNPNQIRNFGIQFWDKQFDKNIGIVIEISDDLDITLIIEGTKIGLMYQFSTK